MKIKYYILQFLFTLSIIIEFTWSVVVSVFEAVGLKLTELVDAIEASIDKIKQAKS